MRVTEQKDKDIKKKKKKAQWLKYLHRKMGFGNIETK